MAHQMVAPLSCFKEQPGKASHDPEFLDTDFACFSENCGNIRPMKNHCVLARTLVLLLVVSSQSAAQVGGGHTLFGDFKIDNQTDGTKPQTFFILLYSVSGKLLSRQTVGSPGRYRFNDVANGEYDLVVESENQEAVKVRIVLMDRTKTEIRHDLNLEWRAKPGSTVPPGSVSVADEYKRRPEQETQLRKAQDFIKKKNYKEAIPVLRQLLSNDQRDFVAWTELGTAQYKQGEVSEAEKSYLSAIEEKPTFLLALLNLGKLRMSEKNFDGAIEVLTKAVDAQPKSSDANFYLGESYLQIKKGSKAVGFFEEALRLDPIEKAEAHIRLGALYRAAGMKDKAAAEYEKFLAKKPNYPDRKQLEQYISENKRP